MSCGVFFSLCSNIERKERERKRRRREKERINRRVE